MIKNIYYYTLTLYIILLILQIISQFSIILFIITSDTKTDVVEKEFVLVFAGLVIQSFEMREICEMKQANTWETYRSANNQTNRLKKNNKCF